MFNLDVPSKGINAISGLYGTLSKIQEIKKNQEILDKLEEILGLKSTLLDAKEEILNLQQRVAAFEREQELAQELAQELEFDQNRGFFWKTDKGERFAYCHGCWVNQKKLSPMQGDVHGHRCYACGSFYSDPSYRPTQTRAIMDYDPLRRK